MAEMAGLRRRGHAMGLLAPERSEVLRQAREQGFPVQPLAVERWRFPFEAVRAAVWLRRERPDVVNTHSSRDGWLVGVAARLAGVPFVIRTRHFDVPVGHRGLSGVVYRRLADHVLTTSPKVTAEFQALFHLPASRVTTLPTGIDLDRFSPEGDRAELGARDDPPGLPRIGMISVIRLAKGHKVLIEAAQRLRQQGVPARYVMVGDGPSRGKAEAAVRALGLEDSVTFMGHRDDVPAVLRGLDLLVMPSLHEGIPQTVLQALATKTPVVASEVGGLPSVIRDGVTGRLVPPGDAGALAGAIRQALADRAATQRMAEAGRRLVEAEHSLEGMLDRLEALYGQRLGVPGPGR